MHKILSALTDILRPDRSGGRLVMTLLVKNEEETLEACLRFHHQMGVDAFVVTDNNSTDSTPQIIERYRRSGWIEAVIHEPGTDYQQKQWVDRMIRLAKKRLGAAWVINADADEFWFSPSGNLRTELEACGGNVAHCQIRSMYPEPTHFTQWTRRVEFAPTEAYDLSPYSIFQPQRGKVAHRTRTYIQIGMGNHKVTMLCPRKRECDIRIYHYNIRSFAEFEKKIINGGKQLELHVQKNHGRHWRYFYDLYKAGRLAEEYERVVGTASLDRLTQDGRLVTDTTMRECFTLLKTQQESCDS